MDKERYTIFRYTCSQPHKAWAGYMSGMQGKICLITGASSGIGRAAALEICRQGAQTWVICRSKARGEETINWLKGQSGHEEVQYLVADLSDLSQVRMAALEMRTINSRLDVLLNNAGVFYMSRSSTADGMESSFGINYLSHFLLTQLLLPLLRNSPAARIVNVSSDAHHWGKLNLKNLQLTRAYNPLLAYGNSKLAQVLFTYELASRLKGTHISVNAMHPGVVATHVGRTNLTHLFFQVLGRPFLLSPEQGARTLVYLASSPEAEGITGKFFEKNRPRTTSAQSYDQQLAVGLWEASLKLVAPFFNGEWLY
jgi:NAD(P)-dependent dehydrogenase (short-subunit alcohol dehydrogenase family)